MTLKEAIERAKLESEAKGKQAKQLIEKRATRSQSRAMLDKMAVEAQADAAAIDLLIATLEKIRDELDVDEDADLALEVSIAKENHGTVLSCIEDAFGRAVEDTDEAVTELEKQGKRSDELYARLVRARQDRNALLHRLGLTDGQWSAQGGACDADLEMDECAL